MDVTGKAVVYKSDKYENSYSIVVYGNSKAGETTKAYMPVTFKKGDEPAESCTIEIVEGFLSCYTGKEKVIPKVVVTTWDLVESYAEKENKNNAQKNTVREDNRAAQARKR